MQQPERLGQFGFKLVIYLIVTVTAWHCLVPYFLHTLWAVADLSWPHIFFDSPYAPVDPLQSGWQIHTGWLIAPDSGSSPGLATLILSAENIQRMVAGTPLLVSLLLTTPVLDSQHRMPPINFNLWVKTVIFLGESQTNHTAPHNRKRYRSRNRPCGSKWRCRIQDRADRQSAALARPPLAQRHLAGPATGPSRPAAGLVRSVHRASRSGG